MAKNVDTTNGQLPLKGIVLCCTSLTQDVRIKLAETATQMGAVHKLDLTSDVTHLIVGNIATPKYRYVAKERPDIKVLHPDWIEAVRLSWMEGGDVDVQALEKDHLLPPFSGLEVCVTGFDSHEQRNFISSTVEEQGATYHGDLTKVVTHLIAAAPQGAKYTHAKQWNVSIVSFKWFMESLERGMSLDENLYDPLMPIEDQGKGAFRRQPKQRTSLGKRDRDGDPQSTGSGDGGKKKLRRTASTRLESQSQEMWQNISARDAGAESLEPDQWKAEKSDATTHVSNTISKADSTIRPAARQNMSSLPLEASEGSESLFSGIYVLMCGFEPGRSNLIQKILLQNGAAVAHTTSQLEDAPRNALFKDRYLIVPHATTGTPIELPEVPTTTIVATEWWIERCIHYKNLINPVADALSRPLWNVEVPGFSDFLVSTTGFGGVDLRQVAEIVKLMGATYQEKVSPSSSVLINASGLMRKEKAFYANKHHIPVVSSDWLWACLETKKKAPFEKFHVELPTFDANKFTIERTASSPAATELLQRKADEATKVKDDLHPKRLSNNRRKMATPSLALHTAKTSPPATLPRPSPILHDDDDNSPSIDIEPMPAITAASIWQRGSQPLKEISPNLSPQKAGKTSQDGNDDVPVKAVEGVAKTSSRAPSPAKPAFPPKSPHSRGESNDSEQQVALRPQHELTADLAEILNRKVASRPGSAAPAEAPTKRKSRPLGRAPSGISNRSLSASNSALSQKTSPILTSEGPESAADGFTASHGEASPPPGTQLGYETAEAEAHRLQMSKKMGRKLQDENCLKRVASLGTVKDSTLNAGVGNRVRGRPRRNDG